jgi:hypothetical protein
MIGKLDVAGYGGDYLAPGQGYPIVDSGNTPYRARSFGREFNRIDPDGTPKRPFGAER